MKRTVLLGILAALALSPVAMAQEPIKVGTIFPLSGGAGPDGQSVTNGVKLALEDINAKGGLLGRKLVLISKDDESTPAVGVSRANEMIAEKVSVVIEGWNSPVTLAMQPILARADILDVTTVSKADLILAGTANPQAIRINSSNGLDAGIIAKYVVQNLKAKRLAFLTQNDAYGNGFQTAVEAEMKKLGFTGEIAITEKFAFKDTDFRVALTNIKSAKPDAVIVTSASNSSGLPATVEQYRQAGIEAPFVGAVGIMLPTVFKIAGAANEGVVSADIYFPGLPPFNAIPENLTFVEAHKKAYGTEPDKSAALGAAALQVWAKAVAETKSLDKKTVAAAIRGKTIKGTLFGDATFAENGQLQPRYVVFKVIEGKTPKLEALPQ